MKAVVIGRFGGPEVLEEREVPAPTPGPGEILVDIAACGVCCHDVLSRKGAMRDRFYSDCGYRLSLQSL